MRLDSRRDTLTISTAHTLYVIKCIHHYSQVRNSKGYHLSFTVMLPKIGRSSQKIYAPTK